MSPIWVDGALNKSLLGREKTGPDPTDSGVKRSGLCDATGITLVVVVDGADRHNVKLFEATLASVVVRRPAPRRGKPQSVCMDKACDSRSVRTLLKDLGVDAHIRSRDEEARDLKQEPDRPAQRWVIECDHGRLNRYRVSLVRLCKKPENYLACLHRVCGFVTYQQSALIE